MIVDSNIFDSPGHPLTSGDARFKVHSSFLVVFRRGFGYERAVFGQGAEDNIVTRPCKIGNGAPLKGRLRAGR